MTHSTVHGRAPKRKSTLQRSRNAGLLLLLCFAATAGAKPSATESPWAELTWRLLGPFRGGWAEMVEGVAGRPDNFFFGAAGGGVWRTDNAGRTWEPLFDQGPAAPVGAIAIAPSNPDILYVGTGQPTPRYDVAGGAGVFRSIDGGRHWTDLGLKETRHIGRIWIDPVNPDHVLVAAVGHFFGSHPARGVYLTRNGGASWTQALKIDDDTGAVDLAADPNAADTVFAASWQARQYPWQSYFTPIAGTGSALWRSDDGGATWNKLGGEGWPTGPLGRISVATARIPAGLRLYAVISADENSGLYRSDDAGGHWKRVNGDKAFTNYYASHVTVAPGDPDVVYLVGQSIRRCDQGGERCDIIKGAPGGDDYHFVWINPKDASHWATASDQGVAITVDGGRTFSSWFNQPTGQFYHLATDDRFPYRIYSGQQDSGTVSMAGRSDYGAPNFRDWNPVGADERDFVIPDPDDPGIVYGSGLGGRLSRYDGRTGQVSNIAPFLGPNYGKRQTTVDHHYVWVTPFAISRSGPVTFYMAAESLFKSTDRGQSWTLASPDLTGKKAGATDCDGDVAAAAARPCGYGGIWSIITSSRHAGEVWVGSDSGLLQMTRDDGGHWSDVTPKGLPAWAKIASIDLSSLEDGVAYIAVDNQRQDDFAPHLYATRDYGKSWRDISAGLPQGQFASVLRADPRKAGLLFAGTETGLDVSLDDGAHWSPLQQNLPTAWVRDIAIHGDDLIVATQGRAIWILDDIAPLRQLTTLPSGKQPRLFTPATAIRVRPDNNKDTPLPPEEPVGENPPPGAVIDYYLGTAATSVALEIRDATGVLVQTLTDRRPKPVAAKVYFAAAWLKPGRPLTKEPGLHRAVWNLRWPRPDAITFKYSIAAVYGRDTPEVPGGAYVLPGTYRVTLRVDGREIDQQSLSVLTDPRTTPDRHALQANWDLWRQMSAAQGLARQSLVQSQVLDEQLAALTSNLPSLTAALAAARGWHSAVAAARELSDQLGEIETDLEGTDLAPTAIQTVTAQQLLAALGAATSAWQAHVRDDLPALNASLARAKLPQLTLASAAFADLTPEDEGEDLP